MRELREISRQMYLPKRAEKELKLLEMQLQDEEELFVQEGARLLAHVLFVRLGIFPPDGVPAYIFAFACFIVEMIIYLLFLYILTFRPSDPISNLSFITSTKFY